MTMKTKPQTLQIESDKRLLEFGAFESYLNSLVNRRDLEYFQDTNVARAIAELGFWSSGQTLDRKQFNIRSALASEFFYPSFKPIKLSSEGITQFSDPLFQELAKRERANLEGDVLTIIFIRTQNSMNFEISSYIDFRHRLKKEKWRKYFLGKDLFVPQSTDLSYFHWRNNNVFTTDTDNFAVTTDPNKGLCFFCKHDRRKIFVNPKKMCGPNSSRFTVPTTLYEQAVLYDHCIMKQVNLTYL